MKRRIGGLLGVVLSVSLLTAVVPSTASAHTTQYCRHGDAHGRAWWLIYGSHFSKYKRIQGGDYYIHFHDYTHWFAPPGGFFNPVHGYRRACSIRRGVPVETLRVLLKLDAPGSEIPLGTEEATPLDTDVPVETPTSEAPEEWTFDKIPGGVRSRGVAGLRLPVDDPLTAARTLRRRGLEVRWFVLTPARTAPGRFVDTPTRRVPPGMCLLSVTDMAGEPLLADKQHKRVALEVATPDIAKPAGHGCVPRGS